MKIKDFNKENALSIKNNLEMEDADEIAEWIEDCCEVNPYLTYQSKHIKIYQAMKDEGFLIVTNLDDVVLFWFDVYDLFTWYETKYEYVYVGHEMNCHVDKLNGELNEYETR